VLGTAEITANARYPFQPTTSAGATSNTLVKEIESLFDKGIICIPKLEGDPPTVASGEKAFCLVFARDIAGEPINEVACVTIIGNLGSVEDFLPDPVPGNPPQLDNRVCVDTDQSGDVPPGANTSGFTTAEIEALFGLEDAATYGVDVVLVIGRGNLTADVRFLEENLNFTDEFSIPPVGTTTGASTGQAPTANQHGLPVLPPPVAGTNPAVVGKLPTPSGNGSGTERRSGSVQNPGNQEVLKPAVLKARASLMFVRIVKPLKLGGVRYVVLRVKSPHKNARVQINVVGKRGKVLGTVLRKVKTNRTIRVPNLRLPKAAVTVRAKLI
jgi:hypothetical protein